MDDVEIRVRVRDDTLAGFRDINGRLRDTRGRFAAEGRAAGAGFAAGIAGGMGRATGSILNTVGAAATLSPVIGGAAAACAQLAGAALLLPGAFSAAAAAAATISVATSGIGAALSAMDAPSGGGGGGGGGGAVAARASARAIRDATDQVNDARRNAARVAEDSARAIARAEREVERATVEAARNVALAKKEQADIAEQTAEQVADALEREEDAQEALTDAREQAGRTLDDLREKVSDYALDEEAARLRVLAALQAQRKVNNDATSTNLEKAQATQNVREAEERLSDVQRERAQDTAKLAEEEAKGVEGSDTVVAAKERVADAEEATAKAREDGAERMAAAAARVAEAEEDGAARIAAAQESLTDTRRDAARANADAQEQVADALQRLKDAQDDANQSMGGGGAAAANAFAAALAKLSPNARAFVLALKELKPAWDAMARSVQDKFFAGFADTVRELGGIYIPVLEVGMGKVASAMNKMALYAADALMKPETVAAVEKIFDNTGKMIDNAGTSLGDFLEGFLKLAGIGSEYLPKFGTWLADIAKNFKDWVNANPEKIREFIDGALVTLGKIGTILGNVWDTLKVIFGSNDDGKSFLDTLVSISATLKEWAPVIRDVLPLLAALWVTSKIVKFTTSVWGAVAALGALGRAGAGGGGGGGGGRGGGRGGRGGGLGRAAVVGGGVLGGVAVGSELMDGAENGSDGSFMTWGDDIGSWLGGLPDQLGPAMDGFTTWWNESFMGGGQGGEGGGSGSLLGTISGFFPAANDILNTNSEGMFSPLGLSWDGISTQLTGGMGGFSNWLGGDWSGGIGGFLGTVFNPFSSSWTGSHGQVSGGMGGFSGFLSGSWAGGIGTTVGNLFSSMFPGWSGAQGSVEGGMGGLSGFASGIGSRIGAAFTSAWRTIENGASGMVSTVRGWLNSLIDSANWAIGQLNRVPGVSIGTIPHFAAGGAVGRSGTALVGEHGPELVRLPGGANVRPASNTSNDLAGAGPQQIQVALSVGGDSDSALANLLMRMMREGQIQVSANAIVGAR